MKKLRQKRSQIWLMPSIEFKNLVKNSNSLAQILRYFNFVTSHGNYGTLKRRLNEENIDYSHIKMGRNSNKHRVFPIRAIPLEKVMIKNSTYSRKSLKIRLSKNGMLKNYCYNCGLPSFWNGKKLVLILDHINGINNDHRLENLRMLCPNCNSQTDTFSGKNNKQKTRNKRKYCCIICGKNITESSNTGKCSICIKYDLRKIKDRPSKEQLLKEIKELGYCAVGRKYGVSDNSIRRWIK